MILSIYCSDYDVDYYNIVNVYCNSIKYLLNKTKHNKMKSKTNVAIDYITEMKQFLPSYIVLSVLIQLQSKSNQFNNSENADTTQTMYKQLISVSNSTNASYIHTNSVCDSLIKLNHTMRHMLHTNQIKLCFDFFLPGIY